MDVFQKFIIVIGGGWWRRAENQPNDFILYGSSDDFGKAEFEDIKNCILNGNVFTNKYSNKSIVNLFNFYYEYNHEIVKIK